MVGGKQCAVSDRFINTRKSHIQKISIERHSLSFFSFCTHRRHHLNRFNRIFTGRCFCRRHHRIGTIQNRIRHIRYFCTRWNRILYHRLHHLRGCNCQLIRMTCHTNHALLQRGHHGIAYFNGEITTCHHNAIGRIENFLQHRNRFSALNFRDHQWSMRVVRFSSNVGQLTRHDHIGCAFRK